MKSKKSNVICISTMCVFTIGIAFNAMYFERAPSNLLSINVEALTSDEVTTLYKYKEEKLTPDIRPYYKEENYIDSLFGYYHTITCREPQKHYGEQCEFPFDGDYHSSATDYKCKYE